MATAVANYVLLGKGNQLLVKLLNFVPTAPLMERERDFTILLLMKLGELSQSLSTVNFGKCSTFSKF